MKIRTQLAQAASECSHGVAAVSCTPGTVADTGIARNLGPGMRWMFRYMGPGLFSRSVPEGAATLAHCMCVPDVVCGGYYENCHVVDNLEGSMADGALTERGRQGGIDRARGGPTEGRVQP